MSYVLSLLADLVSWLFFLGAALIAYAILNPADAAEAVTLPVSAHMLKHATMIGLLAVAGALVTVAVVRKVRP